MAHFLFHYYSVKFRQILQSKRPRQKASRQRRTQNYHHPTQCVHQLRERGVLGHNCTKSITGMFDSGAVSFVYGIEKSNGESKTGSTKATCLYSSSLFFACPHHLSLSLLPVQIFIERTLSFGLPSYFIGKVVGHLTLYKQYCTVNNTAL